MGFVASAQIPPHTAGCAATTCPMYYSCVEDSEGVASCVPPPPPAGPCAAVHCAPGTECVAIGNHAWCKPLPVGCAATQCRYGRTCYEIAGHALCLPSWWFPSPTPPSPPVVGCDQLKCVHCENDPKTGEGVCLPPPIGCGSLECAHCVEDDKGNGPLEMNYRLFYVGNFSMNSAATQVFYTTAYGPHFGTSRFTADGDVSFLAQGTWLL